MAAAEYKVWDVMKAYAFAAWKARGSKGPLLFSGAIVPTLCNAVPCSRNHADTMIARLHGIGWLIPRDKGKRKANGQMSPTVWELVTHDDFVAAHPGSCPPYTYAPDKETADEFGVSYGDKFATALVPHNFWKIPPTPLSEAIRAWEEGLTDDERELIKIQLGKGKPAPTTVGEDDSAIHSHDYGTGDLDNRSHDCGRNPRFILYPLPHPRSSGGGGGG